MRNELHEIERHVGIAPVAAPLRNQLLHIMRVVGVIVRVNVRLALIPDKAPRRHIKQRADHRIVQIADLVRILEAVVRLYDIGLDFAGSGLGHPCLDARAAPCRLNQTDRHAERVVQIAREEIGRRAERSHRLGGRNLPFAPAGVHRLRTGHHRGVEQTDVLILGSLDQGLDPAVDRLAQIARHRHLHVRLPGADPHFADHHVLQRNGIAVADTDRIRTAGSRSGNFQQPLAVGVGLRRIFAAVPRGRDRHLFRRRSLPPQVHLALPLEHHVAADQRRQLDLGESRASHQQ